MTKKRRILERIASGKLLEMPVKKDLFTGTGRRKTAVARVFLYEGKGEFLVNGTTIEDYFKDLVSNSDWMRPFHTIGISHPAAHFNGTIKVHGSGKSSQMDAVIHGISHALSKMSEEYSVALRKQSLLTRDSRMVERKKPYLKKARKAPQFSKR